MAAMLATLAARFFHYTPGSKKKPPPTSRESIAKGLTSKKKFEKTPAGLIFLKCWGSWGSLVGVDADQTGTASSDATAAFDRPLSNIDEMISCVASSFAA